MSYDQDKDELEKKLQEQAQLCEAIISELSKRIVGQEHIARRLLTALVAQDMYCLRVCLA